MRFCMVTTFYPPRHFGGDAVYVQALSRALVRAGHHVEVVCSEDAYLAAGGSARLPVAAEPGNGEDDGVVVDGVVVHRLRNPLGRWSSLWAHQTGSPGPIRAALASVLDRGFDVVHYHNVSLIGGPAVLGMARARAKLLTLHDHWLVCPTHVLWKNGERACDRPTCLTCCLRSRRPPQLWRYGDALPRALAHVDVLLAPSRWSARRHRQSGIDRPIEVLPLYSRFEGAEGMPPQRPRFLYVGRITASKGVRALVQLFAGLPAFELTVAGDGDSREALAREFARASNVRFAGPVDEAALPALYAGATATIVPSLAPESFGLAVVESFAFGTPVLALDAGGCGEIVLEAGGGIVCRDMASLGDAVRRLATDPGLRDELGRRARIAWQSRYSASRHLADYLALVETRLAR